MFCAMWLGVPQTPPPLLIPIVVAGFVALFGILSSDQIREKLDDTYVPPVEEQLANLPLEDVLLRGSDQPVATPAELLRAARPGMKTEVEELLRPAV